MDELTIAFKIESPPSWLPIGRTAENNWRAVEIDCSYWFNMSADGSVVLMYKPSCGMSPYPLLTEREGDNIIWRPKSGELVEGVGRLQAFFEVGTDVIGSSDMISCEVDSSLLGADPGTDPGQTDLPWALDIIEQIAELSGHYPKIENGVLYVWDSNSGEWVQFQGGGSGSSTVIVTIDDTTDPMTASMTAGQIKSAVDSGSVVKMLNGNIFFDCVSANAYLSTFAIAFESGIYTCLVTASGTVTTVKFVDIPSKTSDLTNDSGFVEKVTATVDDTVDPPVASMNAVQIKNAVDSGKTVELDFHGSKLKYAFSTEFAAAFGLSCNGSIITCLVSTSGRVEFTADQIPSLIGYATETWVEGKGYQTAQQVQTAISGVRQLPTVNASDNGKFLRVVNGEWAVKPDDGGSSVTVDDALSTTSENPVQNKVVKAALDGKADASDLASKQDALTAGQNITINGNTISADVDSAEIAANVNDWLNDNVTPVGSAVVVDSSLSIEGAAADAKAVGDAIDNLRSIGTGLSDEAKAALLACFRKVVWIDADGQDYYDALEAALYPPVDLASISATFAQGSHVVYNTDTLDSLRPYLTVRAVYTSGTTQTVTNYTLSGTLTVGTSRINVSYGGKTATFNVVVSAPQALTGYTIVGNPTIDSSYRMTTSDGNFIKTPFNFDNGGKSWELRGKVNFTNANQPSGEAKWYDIANFVGSNNASIRGLLVELSRSVDASTTQFLNRLNIFASSGLSSWDIVSPQSESIQITSLINGDFYFKAGWAGSAYYIAASADGVTWSNELRHEWTGKTTSIMTGYPIAFGNKRNKAWGYCIYVDSLELDIDGVLYWKAVD